jgi:anhydro-N-acetylmuramic acid kinase
MRLEELRRAETLKIVGLMSGTSVDGIDAVLAEIGGPADAPRVRQLAFVTVPYEAELRGEILAVAGGESRSARQLCRLDHVVGEAFGEAALAVVRAAGLSPAQVDLVGSHGQTIYHDALDGVTWQIGEPSRIAAAVGAPVVADFRCADMVAGGQGAPLVPLFDALLFRRPDAARILLNIGGIANVTVLPAGRGTDGVFAFDTGPGNVLIDEFLRQATRGRLTFDDGGELAASGEVDRELVAGFLEHPYFAEEPPKSTGREVFGAGFVVLTLGEGARRAEGVEDLVATLTEFTALSITESIKQYVLPRVDTQELLVSGGGVHNATLMKRIVEELPGLHVASLETAGFSPDAKEALAFALLARETVCGRPGNVLGATGAGRRVLLGVVAPDPAGGET